MKIKHLKEWLNTLTEEHNECNVVFRKVIGTEGDQMMAKDVNIDACGIDTDNNEAYLCDAASHWIIEMNS